MTDLPRLYGDLAGWWPLLSAPEDYAEEAEVYRVVLTGAAQVPISTVLELGSGGGNNASHLKAHFQMTLVDRSPGMLKVSRRLNPECEHHLGDMRTVRLGREFDAVFVHDAVAYLSTADELRAAMRRGMRYLEWTWDPDPDDTMYFADFAYLLHEDGAGTSVLYDRHLCGLFSRDEWLRTLSEVGFRSRYEEATLGDGEILKMVVGVNAV